MRLARYNAIVLNVDGCTDSRNRRTAILRNAGFEVCEADSGSAGLLWARRADVLLLGTRLPDISSHELCRRVKRHAATCSAMILEISGASSECERTRMMDVGADWFLREPLEDDELVATINALVRIRWTQEQLRQRVDELEQLGPGCQIPLARINSLARLSDELSVPLDCIMTWIHIMKEGNLEQSLLQHGMQAIEHNVTLLQALTHELLSQARKSQPS